MDYISASRIGSYLRCPRACGYRYKCGIKTPPAWVMVGGSAMDETLTLMHRATIEGTDDVSLSNLTDYFVTVLERLVIQDEPTGRPDERMREDGVRLLPIYHQKLGKVIKPISVQRKVETTVGGVAALGYVDLEREASDGHTIVSDHKFSKSAQPGRAKNSLQLRVYDRAVGDPTHHTELIILKRAVRKPDVVVQPHVVTESDQRELDRIAFWVNAQFEAGYFPQCSPDSWNCTPEQCGYWNRCRGNPDGPQPIPGEIAFGSTETTTT